MRFDCLTKQDKNMYSLPSNIRQCLVFTVHFFSVRAITWNLSMYQENNAATDISPYEMKNHISDQSKSSKSH